MAWLAVDEDKMAWVFKSKPHRKTHPTMSDYWESEDGNCYPIDREAIDVILGREMTWDDEPVEIKIMIDNDRIIQHTKTASKQNPEEARTE